MIKEELRKIIGQAVPSQYKDKIFNTEVSIVEAGEKYGDYSSNVAMIFGKRIGKDPEEIAQKIIENIKANDIIESAEFAKPGFVNFKIALPYLYKKILEISELGEKYGESNIGNNKTVNIEFISANPTGPLTIGNARGGVIGDVLANIYTKCGWQVTREYYFNDAGGQIDILGHSILGDEEGQYQGEYIEELRKKISSTDYNEAGREAARILIEEIKKTAEKMGVKFDNFFAEGKDLREKDKIEEIIKWLEEKKLSYEKDGATWFRSMEFGDDKDRVLVKSTGEPTYFAVDAAYHRNKFLERKFDKAIDIWGADHYGDIMRIKGFVKALGFLDKFEIILHQFVKLISGGKEVRMSKRTGNFIAVDNLLKQVGRDAYRYFMLAYDLKSHINFDLELAKERSQKNPVYYVQYAYARMCSILEKSKIQNNQSKININNQNTKLLKEPSEINLIKELIKLPDLIKEIYEDNQIQKLPQYAYKLATKFHNFYENCQVISDDKKLTSARIELVKSTQIVLKNTLDLMGISAPEKM